MIFLNGLDWIIRETTKQGKTGVQRFPTQFLENRDFADDLPHMAHKHLHMRTESRRTDRRCCDNITVCQCGLNRTDGDTEEKTTTLNKTELKKLDKSDSIISNQRGDSRVHHSSVEESKARLQCSKTTMKICYSLNHLQTGDSQKLHHQTARRK